MPSCPVSQEPLGGRKKFGISLSKVEPVEGFDQTTEFKMPRHLMRRCTRRVPETETEGIAPPPAPVDDDGPQTDSKEQESLLSWLSINQNLIDSAANILKEDIVAIKKHKIDRNLKLLKEEKRPEAIKLSKNIVTGFQDAIAKAIKDLQSLSCDMAEDLQKRYNLPDEWMQTNSAFTSIAGSEIFAPTNRRKEMENRIQLMFQNDGGNHSDISTNDKGRNEVEHDKEKNNSDNEGQEKEMEVEHGTNKVQEKPTEKVKISLRGSALDQEKDSEEDDSSDGSRKPAEPSDEREDKNSRQELDLIPATDDEGGEEETANQGGDDAASNHHSPILNDSRAKPSPKSKKHNQTNLKLETKETDVRLGEESKSKKVVEKSPEDSDCESNSSGDTCILPVAVKEVVAENKDESSKVVKESKIKIKQERLSVAPISIKKERHSDLKTPEKKTSVESKPHPIPSSSKKSSVKSSSSSWTKIQEIEGELGDQDHVVDDEMSGADKQMELDAPEPEVPLPPADDAEPKELPEVLSSPSLPLHVHMDVDDDDTRTVLLNHRKNKTENVKQDQAKERENSADDDDDVDKILQELETSDKEITLVTEKPKNEDKKEPGNESVKKKVRKKRGSVMDKSERDAMNYILDSDSDSDDKMRNRGSKSKKNLSNELEDKRSKTVSVSEEEGKGKCRKSTSINLSEVPELQKNDPKLKDGAAKLVIEKLDATILRELEEQKFVKLKNYNKMKKKSLSDLKKSESDSEDSFDSDGTIAELRKAVRKLTKSSLVCSATYSKTKRSAASGNTKGRSKKVALSRNRPNDDLLSDESDEGVDGKELLSTEKNNKMISDDDVKSASGSEDLDGDWDEDKNKKKKSQNVNKAKEDGEKKKSKKYKSATISSSGSENEKDKARMVLGWSESDSDSKLSKKRSLRARMKLKKESMAESDSDRDSKKKSKASKDVVVLSSDTDSDFLGPSTSKGKRKNIKKSDSDSASVASIQISDSSESNSDSDFKKSSKKKRRRGDSDQEGKSKKKKRRRIITKDSEDESEKKSSDSDIQEVSGDENDLNNSQNKGRKNIRKIMSSKELAKSTKEAEKEEEERRKRLAEKQKLFNGIHKAPETDKIERLVLDEDPETKEPVIEVDKTIAIKLKPHQAEGIKFMYNACFESVEMIKADKVPGGCILAHCMGLGKTLQSVAFIHTLLTSEICKMKTALIIAPLSTVLNWYNEFRQWTDDAKFVALHKIWEAKNSAESRIDYLRTWHRRGGVGILHYDMFVRLADPKKKNKMKERLRKVIQETLLDPGPDIVICDEGHLLKNCKSQRALAVNQIRTKRRIVLTGTPLQNNLTEYHTMMNFVKPNLLGTLNEFTNRFVNPISNGQHADSTETDVKTMKRRAHVLHRKLEGCVQRCDYSILAPYLPPKYEYIINIRLSPKQEELYKYYLQNVAETDQEQKRRGLLKYYSELVKVWSHPIALTMGKDKNSDMEETSEDDSIKDFIVGSSEEDEKETEVESGEGSNDSKTNPAPKRKTRSQKPDLNEPVPDLAEAVAFSNKWWSSLFKSKEEMYSVELSGKLVILQEILKTCEAIGDRVLVFSQFLTSLDIIEEFLEDWDKEAVEQEKNDATTLVTFPLSEAISGTKRWRKNIEYFRIDGGVKQTDRQRDCDKFNRKSTLSRAKLFLISTKAGGLGINLYGANRVVIFDASWNPSQDMQSIFRVYRFGQDKPCYIYRFIARGTMEQKILRRQITKLSLSSRVVDEHQIQRHFKFDDVNEMFRYDDEEPGPKEAMAVPKDKLLADLILSHEKWIQGYEEFDSLLENRPDEGLSKEEKELAWAEYRVESERQRQTGAGPSSNMSPDMEVQTYMKVKSRLVAGYINATEEQIENATKTAIDIIGKIRAFMLFQNSLPEEKRAEIEPLIDPLKVWLQQSVRTDDPRPAPPPDQPLLRPVPPEFYQQPRLANYFPVQSGVRPPVPRLRYAVPRQMVQPPNVPYIQSTFQNLAANNLQSYRNQLLNRFPNTLNMNGNVNGDHNRRDPLS